MPPCWRHPQIPSFAQTSLPNYDPFSTSSFDHNFGRNDNQTFIVYAESTLVLYGKGLCGLFSVLRFTLEEKLCCTKCCKYFRPEGVVFNQLFFPLPSSCHIHCLNHMTGLSLLFFLQWMKKECPNNCCALPQEELILPPCFLVVPHMY